MLLLKKNTEKKLSAVRLKENDIRKTFDTVRPIYQIRTITTV